MSEQQKKELENAMNLHFPPKGFITYSRRIYTLLGASLVIPAHVFRKNKPLKYFIIPARSGYIV